MRKKNYDWQSICIAINTVRVNQNPIMSKSDWKKKLQELGCPNNDDFFVMFARNWMKKTPAGNKKCVYTLQDKPILKVIFEDQCNIWLAEKRKKGNASSKASYAKAKKSKIEMEYTFPLPQNNPTLTNALKELESRGYVVQESKIPTMKQYDDNTLIALVKTSGYRVFQVKKEEV